MKVAPVAEVPAIMPPDVPQIYISRTVSQLPPPSGYATSTDNPQPAPHIGFDIDLIGDCDVVVAELCRRAGWELKHEMIPNNAKVSVVKEEGYESRYTFERVDTSSDGV